MDYVCCARRVTMKRIRSIAVLGFCMTMFGTNNTSDVSSRAAFLGELRDKNNELRRAREEREQRAIEELSDKRREREQLRAFAAYMRGYSVPERKEVHHKKWEKLTRKK
jgi:hypothetical protein